MIDPTRGTGGGERKKSEKRIKYDLWRKDPSMEEGAPVWERSTKPGSWRPLNLTDPGVTLPPLNAYVPPAPVRKSPTPSRPPSASRQSPSDVPIRSSKVASLTISRTDSRSLLIDQEETGKSEKTGKPEDLALLEEVYKPPVMNEALLKSLSHRGKAAYICPRGQECTMGGIDNDGNPTIYRHNSAFRQHIERHMKPFTCDVPGCWKKEGFARPITLRKHKAMCNTQRQRKSDTVRGHP